MLNQLQNNSWKEDFNESKCKYINKLNPQINFSMQVLTIKRKVCEKLVLASLISPEE